MTVFERMAVQMKNTKLYKMNGSSLVEAEMRAYAHALQAVDSELDSMLRNCFFDEPTSSICSLFERLFCFSRTNNPSLEPGKTTRAKKIEMMKKRLAIRNNNFNHYGVQQALLSAGIDAVFSENFATAVVTVKILSDGGFFPNNSERDEFIRNMMPCSATITIQ